MKALKAVYLDASAIVKLFIKEEGSNKIQQFLKTNHTVYTTSTCFYEALGVFKVLWLYRKNDFSKDQYLSVMDDLMATFTDETIVIDDVEIKSREVFSHVEKLIKVHSLDMSDAFQIYSVKYGYFSTFTGGSKPILVTADKDLASAARKEGLRVWDCYREPVPNDDCDTT